MFNLSNCHIFKTAEQRNSRTVPQKVVQLLTLGSDVATPHQSCPGWARLSAPSCQHACFWVDPDFGFLMRGSSIKVAASEGVFTQSQQVCVNMSRVKYEPGLPTASFVLNKTNTNHTNS